jgi:hypothetical protein
MTRELKELIPHLQQEGFDLATYSPGDGVTRYKIVPRGRGYFDGRTIASAVGAKAAVAVVLAFFAGLQEGRWEAE